MLRLGETDTWPFGPVEYHFSPLSHIDMARCLADAVDNPAAENKTIRMGGPDCLTWGEFLTMIAKEAGINAHYTKGISKEALIEGIRKNPGNRVFSPEQIQDVMFDSVIDFKQIHDIFNMEFQRVAGFPAGSGSPGPGGIVGKQIGPGFGHLVKGHSWLVQRQSGFCFEAASCGHSGRRGLSGRA